LQNWYARTQQRRELLIEQQKVVRLNARARAGSPILVSELTPSPFGGVMAKTLKPSRSSLERTSLAAAASTVRVTISPAGVPKRQMNSAIFRVSDKLEFVEDFPEECALIMNRATSRKLIGHRSISRDDQPAGRPPAANVVALCITLEYRN